MKEQGEGTGLGLSIVQQIVKKFGGTIAFPDSEIIAIDKNAKISANVSFGDIEKGLAFENNFFDVIISIYALYYVKDTQKVLSILKTKLKQRH